jgi:hypothetical protein
MLIVTCLVGGGCRVCGEGGFVVVRFPLLVVTLRTSIVDSVRRLLRGIHLACLDSAASIA